jgi:hypothetical protein
MHIASWPHRLVVRTSRRGRDNPGSTPGVVIFDITRARWGTSRASAWLSGSCRIPAGPAGPVGTWPGLGHVLSLGYVSSGAPRGPSAPAGADALCGQLRYMPNLRRYAPMFRKQVGRVLARAARANSLWRPSLACVRAVAAGAHFQSARRVELGFLLCRRNGQPPPPFQKPVRALPSEAALLCQLASLPAAGETKHLPSFGKGKCQGPVPSMLALQAPPRPWHVHKMDLYVFLRNCRADVSY